jgi:phage terminase large subunit-like protein
MPELKRIVVAVDPSGGDKERNDEVGLVVVGIRSRG